MKILITGATDGIGLETARKFKSLGHTLLIHGRNEEKLRNVGEELGAETYRADLSNLEEVKALARDVLAQHSDLDILVNNAGVYKTPHPLHSSGLDVRFLVNTIAPFVLTKKLLRILQPAGRVINLSSAAQSSVSFDALLGRSSLDDFEAYAQSKLAITLWTQGLAEESKDKGPTVIAVNPGSLLGTKMVKEGFGTSGNDINIGVNILVELALDETHAKSSGRYFDNDNGNYASPQADSDNHKKIAELMSILKEFEN